MDTNNSIIQSLAIKIANDAIEIATLNAQSDELRNEIATLQQAAAASEDDAE